LLFDEQIEEGVENKVDIASIQQHIRYGLNKKGGIMKKLLLYLSFVSLTIIANAQWQQTSLDSGNIHCLAVIGSNIFVGTDYGVFISSNDGKNWALKNNGLSTYKITSSLMQNGDTLFAGTGSGLFMSSDSANNWISKGFSDTSICSIAIGSNKILVTNYFGVYLSSNNGHSWTAINNGLPDNSARSIAINSTFYYTGTDYRGMYISGNNGNNWTPINFGLPLSVNVYPYIYEILISDTNIYIANGGVYLSKDNGGSWSEMDFGISSSVSSLIVAGNRIFAGCNGAALSMNNGTDWIPINDGFPSNLFINNFAIKDDTLFAGTTQYGVWKRPLSELTGLEKVNNTKNNISIFPNPALNNITIESPQKSTIEILNIQGQMILQQPLQQGKTGIDVSGLAKGVYILRLKSNDKTAVTRIVKE